MNKTTVAAAVAAAPYVLAADVAAQVKTQALALSAADVAFENATASVAECVARILGAEPSFDHWEAVALAFCTEYKTARGCADKTAANRWSMVAKELESRFALEKPRKETAAAAKMAEKRQKEADAIKAAKAQHGSIEALRTAVAKEKDPAKVRVLSAALTESVSEAEKDSTKKAKEAEKALREEARKIIAALDLKALEKALPMLRKMVPAVKTDAAPI